MFTIKSTKVKRDAVMCVFGAWALLTLLGIVCYHGYRYCFQSSCYIITPEPQAINQLKHTIVRIWAGIHALHPWALCMYISQIPPWGVITIPPQMKKSSRIAMAVKTLSIISVKVIGTKTALQTISQTLPRLFHLLC